MKRSSTALSWERSILNYTETISTSKADRDQECDHGALMRAGMILNSLSFIEGNMATPMNIKKVFFLQPSNFTSRHLLRAFLSMKINVIFYRAVWNSKGLGGGKVYQRGLAKYTVTSSCWKLSSRCRKLKSITLTLAIRRSQSSTNVLSPESIRVLRLQINQLAWNLRKDRCLQGEIGCRLKLTWVKA